MKYDQFSNNTGDLEADICKQVFYLNKDKIKIKKEQTVLKNLKKIFDAALTLGIEKGFQAMTMRDLSEVSRLSMGALYSYFSSKEEILRAFLTAGENIIQKILMTAIEKEQTPEAKLETVLKTHLFLSERMQKWFFFSYMEARHLNPVDRERAVQAELYTEKLIEDILLEGHRRKVFTLSDHSLCASVIKAMLQDFYLKRGKYARKGVDVDQYAEFIISLSSSFCKFS